MQPPYIPTKDSLLDTWLLNFSTLFTANPSGYGFSSSDATVVANAYATWHAAYVVTQTPTTRSKPNIANKDAAKATALATVRPYAVSISLNKGVTNDQKAAIGVTVRGTGPTPIAAPSTSPILTWIAGTPGQATIRYADQNTPSSRAKPPGALQIQLCGAASVTVVTDPTTLPQLAVATKNPMGLNLPSGSVGKTVYLAARWLTRTGLYGPWSNIIAFTGT
jgi:hypothetical protein